MVLKEPPLPLRQRLHKVLSRPSHRLGVVVEVKGPVQRHLVDRQLVPGGEEGDVRRLAPLRSLPLVVEEAPHAICRRLPHDHRLADGGDGGDDRGLQQSRIVRLRGRVVRLLREVNHLHILPSDGVGIERRADGDRTAPLRHLLRRLRAGVGSVGEGPPHHRRHLLETPLVHRPHLSRLRQLVSADDRVPVLPHAHLDPVHVHLHGGGEAHLSRLQHHHPDLSSRPPLPLQLGDEPPLRGIEDKADPPPRLLVPYRLVRHGEVLEVVPAPHVREVEEESLRPLCPLREVGRQAPNQLTDVAAVAPYPLHDRQLLHLPREEERLGVPLRDTLERKRKAVADTALSRDRVVPATLLVRPSCIL